MKIKKTLVLMVAVCLLNTLIHAQTGLERIEIEKYYVSNDADAAQADLEATNNNFSIGSLPVGSATYRFYADMRPGYKLLTVFANKSRNQSIKFTTTTFFYNSPEGTISPVPGTIKASIKNNLRSLDSYLTFGAVAAGNYGILKTEDNGVLNNITSANNPAGVLLNNAFSTGIPLIMQDGMIAGSGIITPSFMGFSSQNEEVFGDGSTLHNNFELVDGAIYSSTGAAGPIPATNKVLIAQITTDGMLFYELNVSVKAPDGTIEYYVAQNPSATDIVLPGLMGGSECELPPMVSILSPADNSTLKADTIIQVQADAWFCSPVKYVDFLVDNVLISSDSLPPYKAAYHTVIGQHFLTVRAYFDNGSYESDVINFSCTSLPNISPIITITDPSNHSHFITGWLVPITANAADPDGTVKSVEFFADNVSIGNDTTAPYTVYYAGQMGNHYLTAQVTDNAGAQTISSVDSIFFYPEGPPIAPAVIITSPANGAIFLPATISIAATAYLPDDGFVAGVEFLVDGVSVGIDYTAPYKATYNASSGGSHVIIANATSNKGITGTDTVSFSVVNNNQSYTVGTITGPCTDPSFCLPVVAVDTVKNVIGYDLVLHYDPTKVQPTDNITINSSLINPVYASYVIKNDVAQGLINISVFLNATAANNTAFNGVGELFCFEFTKTSIAIDDTTTFIISDLQESYIIGVSHKLAQAGEYINKKNTLFKGSLKFWTDNSPIKYDAANPSHYLITTIYGANGSCVKLPVAQVQPDLKGKFTYNTLNGTSIQIERDILPATNVQPVINGFDAALGNKVLVNDASFIPTIYQMIALDVNADGVVSAGDISQINQRSVKTITEFKQKWNYSPNGTSNGQLSKDWLFVDSVLLASPAYKKSATYPLADGVGYSKAKVPVVPFCLKLLVSNSTPCPVYKPATFTGILLGDVNGNYDTISADGKIKKLAGSGAIFPELYIKNVGTTQHDLIIK